jgi:hypothetical protein
VTIDTAISGLPTCVRKAWLVLPSGATIQLDNPAGGWFCQSLDLGTPVPRTVMNSAPDQDGIIDRTQYMGARTVTAAITALTGAGASSIDAVAASFAPYMVPSQRPVLHYVLDRPGAPERTLTLRPDAYDWPIVGAAQRDIALQWIAPNPIAYAPTQQSVTIADWATWHNASSPGDVPFRPVLTITGPVTGPRVSWQCWPATGPVLYYGYVWFVNTYVVAAGTSIVIDCAAHTALAGTTSILNQLLWTGPTSGTTWPVLVVAPGYNRIQMDGVGGSNGTGTQCVVSWYDGYLT